MEEGERERGERGEGEVGRGGGGEGGMSAWLVGMATAGHTGWEGREGERRRLNGGMECRVRGTVVVVCVCVCVNVCVPVCLSVTTFLAISLILCYNSHHPYCGM